MKVNLNTYSKITSWLSSKKNIHNGFSLIELLISIGLSAIVIATAMGTIGSAYFSQKKVQISQNFASETRLLMERVVQMIRNNTIDYDRFFKFYGPSTADCPNFSADQTSEIGGVTNDLEGRQSLSYASIFYWDTDGDGIQDRNLGGVNPLGSEDLCTKVTNDQSEQNDQNNGTEKLFLINAERNVRIALQRNGIIPENRKIEIQQQLSADIDGDGKADIWGPFDGNNDGDYGDAGDTFITWNEGGNGLCELRDNTNVYSVLGEKTSEDFCKKAHDWEIISPDSISVIDLIFQFSPKQDPFLSFAIDNAQIHPHVVILLQAKLRSYEDFGMEEAEAPIISLQTTASSRVFGNTR